MKNRARLILASSSPRRRQLLTDAGYEFEVFPPRDEAEDNAPLLDDPAALVADLARRKAADVVKRLSNDAWVLAADTVAECHGEILGKPADEADAKRILLSLSGQRHRVLSGVCLWNAASQAPAELVVAESTLLMAPLTSDWLDAYLASGGWQGKAGAFGYQDNLGVVRIVDGSESNVVGLPMAEVQEMLAEHGGISLP